MSICRCSFLPLCIPTAFCLNILSALKCIACLGVLRLATLTMFKWLPKYAFIHTHRFKVSIIMHFVLITVNSLYDYIMSFL